MSAAKERQTASQGEVNRLQGNYSQAINCFSALLADPRVTPKREIWLRAHRGAAYGAMLALDEATADLQRAIGDRKGPYPWAQAQLGEANRVYVLTYMAELEREDMWEKLALALRNFDEAIAQKHGDPWMLAHRGAAYTNAYWAARRLPPLEVADRLIPMVSIDPRELSRRAIADFEEAIRLSPGYAWAYGFHAFLLVLMDNFHGALEQLGKAQAYDVNPHMGLHMLRNLAKIWSYQHNYRLSVDTASLALQRSPTDLVATYFLAVGLAKQHDPTAPLAIRKARHFLSNAQLSIDYMRAGLDSLEGREPAPEVLQSILKNGDIEVKSIFFHDPTWSDQDTKWAEMLRKG